MKIILLQPLAGSNYSLCAGRLVETSEATAEKLVRDSVARPLKANEPTQDQESQVFYLDDGVGAVEQRKKPKKAKPFTDPHTDKDVDDSDSDLPG